MYRISVTKKKKIEIYIDIYFFLFKDIHKDDYIAQMHHIVRQRQQTQIEIYMLHKIWSFPATVFPGCSYVAVGPIAGDHFEQEHHTGVKTS